MPGSEGAVFFFFFFFERHKVRVELIIILFFPFLYSKISSFTSVLYYYKKLGPPSHLELDLDVNLLCEITISMLGGLA